MQRYAAAVPLNSAVTRVRLKALARTKLVGHRDYALLTVFLATGRWAALSLTVQPVLRDMLAERHCYVFSRAYRWKRSACNRMFQRLHTPSTTLRRV